MKTLIKKMNRGHFDVSDGEIVVYKDPLIGRLESRDKRLVVKLNREAYQLELWVDGRPVSVFDLAAGVAKACQDGFAAYFFTFEQLMGSLPDEQLELARPHE